MLKTEKELNIFNSKGIFIENNINFYLFGFFFFVVTLLPSLFHGEKNYQNFQLYINFIKYLGVFISFSNVLYSIWPLFLKKKKFFIWYFNLGFCLVFFPLNFLFFSNFSIESIISFSMSLFILLILVNHRKYLSILFLFTINLKFLAILSLSVSFFSLLEKSSC